MKYRQFGKSNEQVSILGLGISQLPQSSTTETDASIKLIRQAIDGGINYLDLGPTDHIRQYDRIASLVQAALQDGYREKVKIAAHLSVSLIDNAGEMHGFLDGQLEWTRVDKFDCYFLDGLQRNTWPVVQKKGILRRAEQALEDGRIDRLGFAFRDQHHYLRQVLEEYDNWGICQFQYNYMEVDRNPGLNGIRYASEHGLPVVAAEPLRGGMLTAQPPEAVAAVWAGAGYERSLAEWGLRWVWNHPEITTVVCDMMTEEQLSKNLATADRGEANSFGVRDQLLISQVRDAYRTLRPIPCNACRSCMPCPQDIDVPRILELYNDAIMYDDSKAAGETYHNEEHSLEDCDECGSCAKNCGRMIAILDWLQDAKAMFEKQ